MNRRRSRPVVTVEPWGRRSARPGVRCPPWRPTEGCGSVPSSRWQQRRVTVLSSEDGGVTPELAGRLLFGLHRAWQGAELCRHRLEDSHRSAPFVADDSVPIKDFRGYGGHEVDYYAWEAERIIRIALKAVKAGLHGRAEVEEALDELVREAPLLREFRDAITHPEDNRTADDIVYFTDAVRLRPGGGVEYVLDPRWRTHDALERLAAATRDALLTLAPADHMLRREWS